MADDRYRERLEASFPDGDLEDPGEREKASERVRERKRERERKR